MKHKTSLGFAARRRAISLIEGVLYLVIALAIIVGGIVFFQQSQLSNRVTDTARAAVGISSQMRALYQNQNVFGDNVDLTSAALKSGAVPSNFIGGAAADSIVHPFDGGSVTIMGIGRGFVMSYSGITAPACQRMAIIDETGSGPMGIGIAGVTIGTSGDFNVMDGPSLTAPVTPESISSACANGDEIAIFYAATVGGKFDDMMAGFTGPDLGKANRDNPGNYPFPSRTAEQACGYRPTRTDLFNKWGLCAVEWSYEEYGNAGQPLDVVCGGPRPTADTFPGEFEGKASLLGRAKSAYGFCVSGHHFRVKYREG